MSISAQSPLSLISPWWLAKLLYFCRSLIKGITMIEQLLETTIVQAVQAIFNQTIEPAQAAVQKTRKDFEGDYTLAVFPFVRFARRSPEETANIIGEYLKTHIEWVSGFNVIKGFLNIVISDEYWLHYFREHQAEEAFGFIPQGGGPATVVEYSSPNTNKPLHLGHIRNNLLGFSVAKLLAANGKTVKKVNLVNDRGIHICKSMLAWQKWGGGETPESSGLKGDHLVGKYYVKFDQEFRLQVAELIAGGMKAEDAEKQAPLIRQAQDMLLKWEAHDDEVLTLWKMMNSWVYKGFDVTYKTMGVDFDKIYYESETYLHGKRLVEEGMESGTFERDADGSVWIDLTSEGLDRKLLLRADGTSVYMTQDLGTAQMRYNEFNPEKLIYVVGNEQNYHFDVLKLVLRKLGRPWAESILHLSYGMVELPEGKMKSREGKVVDADDLMDEMFATARAMTTELGKTDDFSEEEADALFRMIGLGALKYFILKVDPKKNMLFNPRESIDFNGNTGPFIQYTYARIRSVLRKANVKENVAVESFPALLPKERSLLVMLYEFPATVQLAGDSLSPALIANYVFELSKEFNQFYHDITILNEPDAITRAFRISLARMTGNVIRNAMSLLGIEVPERM
jgi:arginyl-tRNA synthetase